MPSLKACCNGASIGFGFEVPEDRYAAQMIAFVLNIFTNTLHLLFNHSKVCMAGPRSATPEVDTAENCHYHYVAHEAVNCDTQLEFVSQSNNLTSIYWDAYLVGMLQHPS